MKLRRRRKLAANTGRKRAQPEASTLEKPPLRASRKAPEANTGRQINRQAVKSVINKSGSYWIQRFGITVLMVAALISAINILTLSNTAKVIQLDDDKSVLLRDVSVYENAASDLLDDSIWNRNKITVDTSHVKRELLKQFPELATVSVTIPMLAHRPIVYVQPARPALILSSGAGAFLVDTSGKALLRAKKAEDLNQPGLPVVADQSGLKLSPNTQALASSQVSFIRIVIAQLAARQLTVAAITLPPAASQIDVQITGQPYLVKFNLHSNTPREQAGTFLATLEQLKKQNITPSQYVDVRVAGRAYYK